MNARGKWTWFNQYGSQDFGMIIRRAKAINIQGIITKANHWAAFDAFKAAGIRLGVERYTYPSQPVREARYLADGIDRGAEFAVINAEVEWERAGAGGGDAMTILIAEFKRLHPLIEIYASVDTRGSRTQMAYQQVLGREIKAWMPMIYPKAFFNPPL